MSSPDDFDEFLKSSFEKTNYTIADEGFSKRVMANLPENRIPLINRNYILYLSCALAVFIFFVSNGYKALFLSLIDILSNGFHSITLSLNSFFVIAVFISVSFIISRIEHDEDLI
jgi:hypothetical protein